MRPEALKFLWDIIQACDRLDEFTAGHSLEDYLGDPMLQSAVERQFIIIGEALFHAMRRDPSLEAVITDAQAVVSFRHVMVHGYASIKPATVWGSVQEELATLRREVEALLAANPPQP
jgi:uncharacterized protein with HEPN domain